MYLLVVLWTAEISLDIRTLVLSRHSSFLARPMAAILNETYHGNF
jgi:hypothetical protein